MWTTQQLSNILFLDIETVRATAKFEELSEDMQRLWELKSRSLKLEDQSPAESYADRGGIYAEFGKIVCISFGMLHGLDSAQPSLRLGSFYGADERAILADFKQLLDEKLSGEKYRNLVLCAHNGKEFDFPYMCRRYIVQQIPLPKLLHIQGKKPWEIPHLDTMDFWKFGDWKASTKLELLCHLLGIPSPKSDMEGSQVNEVFWDAQHHRKIARYCEQDVGAIAQLMLRYSLQPLIAAEHISYSIPENPTLTDDTQA
ncbi:3'-5' exonuclease [Eisenibacter elegans]|uniref:3'-5' exonuclease n=1 Tax=Eisenibacter elegans TaxID=997 RepID=UPI0006885B6D|nr:3'-5' exonuclease [Eisenibacter elegans]